MSHLFTGAPAILLLPAHMKTFAEVLCAAAMQFTLYVHKSDWAGNIGVDLPGTSILHIVLPLRNAHMQPRRKHLIATASLICVKRA